MLRNVSQIAWNFIQKSSEGARIFIFERHKIIIDNYKTQRKWVFLPHFGQFSPILSVFVFHEKLFSRPEHDVSNLSFNYLV